MLRNLLIHTPSERLIRGFVDLIVMEGYGHSRLQQRILNGVTRGTLRSMTVPALKSH